MGVTVLYEGARVKDGTVQIVVKKADAREHWYSQELEPDGPGRFKGLIPKQADDPASPLKVTASYIGQVQSDADKMKQLTGKKTHYIGKSPAPTAFFVGTLGSLAATAIVLVFIFTGYLTRARARAMFMAMYLITFFSALGPLIAVLLIPQSPYLLDLMRRAPVGLVQATAEGIPEEQWILNVGGIVESAEIETTTPAGATGPAASPKSADTDPTNDDQDGTDKSNSPGEKPDTKTVDKFKVTGGLAIPFYVVILSMIGASINMTRKVPQIQKTSAAVELPGVVGWQTLVSAPLTMFRQTGYPSSAIATEAGKLRADTIKNFMYYSA